MLSIGAFAQIGQVTHRMLRHWDQAGLLVPAHVDEFNGYRSYDPSQLDRLHRIVALRALGFGLDDISALLAEGVGPDRLAGLLSERRGELEREHALATARLFDVERRLRFIAEEKTMPGIEIVTKKLPAVRMAARTFTVAEQPEIGPLVGPAFDAVADAVTAAHGPGRLGIPMATYTMVEDGITAVVGFEYGGEVLDGFEIAELPAVDEAFCTVHLGSMAGIGGTWQALHTELTARGFAPSAPGREVYLRAEGEDQSDWVTEIQQPVTRAR
ncbi:MerR family transcriptional regulator [Myceligenerans crystallogenes]|uniref:MerR family transcriptional regulator n=1 Tax=Myceligenerans crystallogenes TaxID=316335 RepID=A0ABN2N391_9MICO